jgi:hypothetical protein
MTVAMRKQMSDWSKDRDCVDMRMGCHDSAESVY